jgi:hypothetical protein
MSRVRVRVVKGVRHTIKIKKPPLSVGGFLFLRVFSLRS